MKFIFWPFLLLTVGCSTVPPTNVHQPMTARPAPRFEMANKCFRKPLIARQEICNAEREKMLMAVQLPDDLFIARFAGVEFVKLLPMLSRGPVAGNRFEMPIDFGANVQVLVSEQVKAAGNYQLGLINKMLARGLTCIFAVGGRSVAYKRLEKTLVRVFVKFLPKALGDYR